MFPKLDQEEFKLNFDDKINEYQLTVTNVFGQVVLSEFRKDKSSSVIIGSPAGVYIVTVEISDGTKISQRVVKF